MTDTETKSTNRYMVPALAQGLSVLALFTRERPVWTPPEIASELQLARATVFRLLQTLDASGYLLRESNGRSFRLGVAVLNRGFAYLSSLDLVEIAQPILQRLRDKTGLSTHLAIRDGSDVVYIARVAGHTRVSSSVTVGTRYPVHATTLGRMLICDFSNVELERLFPDERLVKSGEQTPVSRTALAALLAGDRARGYAVSQSFFEAGVSAVAAPVRNANGQIVAAINVTAVDTKLKAGHMNGALKDEVLNAANDIARWIVTEAARLPPAGGKK